MKRHFNMLRDSVGEDSDRAEELLHLFKCPGVTWEARFWRSGSKGDLETPPHACAWRWGECDLKVELPTASLYMYQQSLSLYC